MHWDNLPLNFKSNTYIFLIKKKRHAKQRDYVMQKAEMRCIVLWLVLQETLSEPHDDQFMKNNKRKARRKWELEKQG